MNFRIACKCLLTFALGAGLAFSQENDAPSQKNLVRVGIAVPVNLSGRSLTPAWERDQFIRELQRMRTDRKSRVVVEAVALDANSAQNAATEAAQKGCQYFVLTNLTGAGQGGVIGDTRGASSPTIIGNTKPGSVLAADFQIIDVTDQRTLAGGTTTALTDDREEINSTRAADEAMRMAAHRVASELRKNHPPQID